MLNEHPLTTTADIHDCRAWFDRAVDRNDRVALADWALKYGRSLCENTEEALDLDNSDLVENLKEQVKSAEDDANEAEAQTEDLREDVKALHAAICEAVKIIRPLAARFGDATCKTILETLDELELSL